MFPRGQTPSIQLIDESPFMPANTASTDPDQDPNAQVTFSPLVKGGSVTALGTPLTQEQYAEFDRMTQQLAEERRLRLEAVAQQAAALLPQGEGLPALAMAILAKAMKEDPDYAWTWHCNLAMPIHDSMSDTQPQRHALANIAAARIMAHVFDVNTMSTYETDLKREHLTTSAQTTEPAAKVVVTNEMVERFLSWPLPADFSPDGGISFQRESSYDHPEFGRTKAKPIGTNLFTAIQARAMLEHCVQGGEEPQDPNAKE